jgi:hypothetical protein
MRIEEDEKKLARGLIGLLEEKDKSKPYDEKKFCTAWLDVMNGGAP